MDNDNVARGTSSCPRFAERRFWRPMCHNMSVPRLNVHNIMCLCDISVSYAPNIPRIVHCLLVVKSDIIRFQCSRDTRDYLID